MAAEPNLAALLRQPGAAQIVQASENFPGGAGAVAAVAKAAAADAAVAVSLADLRALRDAAAAAGVDEALLAPFSSV